MADEAVVKKPFYTSKTLWVNFIALIALGVQTQTGYIISAEYQGYAIMVVNMILRLVTKSAVTVS